MTDLVDREYCEDGHRCLNGATCVRDPDNSASFLCDCSTMPDYASHPHAGRYCEFGASFLCYEDNAIMDVPTNYELSFCTNGGMCNEILEVDSHGMEHAGCDCLEGYEGDRCEYLAGTSPKPSGSRGDPYAESGDDSAAIWIMVLSIVSLITFCVLGRREMIRRKHREEVEKVNDMVLRSDTAVMKGEASLPQPDEIKNFGNVSVVLNHGSPSKPRTTAVNIEQVNNVPRNIIAELNNTPTEAPVSVPSTPPPLPPSLNGISPDLESHGGDMVQINLSQESQENEDDMHEII